MYKNLEAEMTRYSIKQSDLAEVLETTQPTISLKLTGKSIITIDEAKKIQNLLFNVSGELMTIDYLFNI